MPSRVKQCLALLFVLTLGMLAILGYRFHQSDDYHVPLATPVLTRVHASTGRTVPFSIRSGKYAKLQPGVTSLGSVHSNPAIGIPGRIGIHTTSPFYQVPDTNKPTSVLTNASSIQRDSCQAGGNQSDSEGSETAVDDGGTENTTVHSTSHTSGEDPGYASLSACIEVGKSPREDSSHGWQTFKQALEHYKHFHHQQLSILKNIFLLHSGNPQGDHLTNETVRTLTWACEAPIKCSGLGDQFFRIQLVFLLAMMTKRIFIISWDKESQKTTQYVQPNEIDWSFFDRDLGMHTKHDIRKLVNRGHYAALFKLLNSSKPHVTMTEELYVPFLRGYYFSIHSDPNIMSGLKQLGLGDILSLSTRKYTKEPGTFISGKILRYLFKFSPDVLSTVDEMQRSLGILHPQHYLAIHIRTGFLGNKYEERGHLNPHRVYRSNATWLNTLDCSLRLADQLIGPNSPVFLASDSYVVKDVISQRYGHRIRTANVTLQHVQYIGKKRQNARMDGFMATWIDFLMLARSYVLVHSISGFSNIAGQFCSNPRQYCVPDCKC